MPLPIFFRRVTSWRVTPSSWRRAGGPVIDMRRIIWRGRGGGGMGGVSRRRGRVAEQSHLAAAAGPPGCGRSASHPPELPRDAVPFQLLARLLRKRRLRLVLLLRDDPRPGCRGGGEQAGVSERRAEGQQAAREKHQISSRTFVPVLGGEDVALQGLLDDPRDGLVAEHALEA